MVGTGGTGSKCWEDRVGVADRGVADRGVCVSGCGVGGALRLARTSMRLSSTLVSWSVLAISCWFRLSSSRVRLTVMGSACERSADSGTSSGEAELDGTGSGRAPGVSAGAAPEDAFE